MEGNWGMVIDLVTTIMAAVSYGYYHWQFFSFADDFLDRTVSKRQMLLTFFINYAVLFLCSVLEFHLIVNWSVVFIVLWGEIRIIYKEKFLQSIYVALAGASNGLALNIILRCAFSIAQDLPLSMYDNNMENIKRVPVILGFLFTGFIFQMVRRFGLYRHSSVLKKDNASLRFLVLIMCILYAYLALNLLTYYTEGNVLVMKIWGIKSAVFSTTGYLFASAYSVRMAVLRQYEEKNREQRASLINEKHEEEQVRILAYTDLLTGCYNRQYANEILRSFWDTEETFTLCFVDLDGLKKVNDVMGHIEGDEYIRLAAKAIGTFIRKEDYLFRYGGDEFLIVSRTLTPDIVSRRMEQVNEALAQESLRRKITLKMAVSYGVAAREESATLDELIRLADQRMYAAKQETR